MDRNTIRLRSNEWDYHYHHNSLAISSSRANQRKIATQVWPNPPLGYISIRMGAYDLFPPVDGMSVKAQYCSKKCSLPDSHPALWWISSKCTIIVYSVFESLWHHMSVFTANILQKSVFPRTRTLGVCTSVQYWLLSSDGVQGAPSLIKTLYCMEALLF